MTKSGNRKKILNSKTGRMVYIDGDIGKKLLAKAHKSVKKTITPTISYQISGAKISNWMDNKVPKSYWNKKWVLWTSKERRHITSLINYLVTKAYDENSLYKSTNPPGSRPAHTYQFGINFIFTNTELFNLKNTDKNITKKFIKYFGFKLI